MRQIVFRLSLAELSTVFVVYFLNTALHCMCFFLNRPRDSSTSCTSTIRESIIGLRWRPRTVQREKQDTERASSETQWLFSEAHMDLKTGWSPMFPLSRAHAGCETSAHRKTWSIHKCSFQRMFFAHISYTSFHIQTSPGTMSHKRNFMHTRTLKI